MLSAELLPATSGKAARCSGPVPMINHNGTTYAVADPGVEWHLRGNVLNATLGQYYRVSCAGRCAAGSVLVVYSSYLGGATRHAFQTQT
jgi:hypothetical protein